ncbi:hypothetical protein HYU23_03095 [Candidatus Woesearchaeota archaeon]|nr:hypothetical protein [Candidatus Woesearchaeota archaeon]
MGFISLIRSLFHEKSERELIEELGKKFDELIAISSQEGVSDIIQMLVHNSVSEWRDRYDYYTEHQNPEIYGFILFLEGIKQKLNDISIKLKIIDNRGIKVQILNKLDEINNICEQIKGKLTVHVKTKKRSAA